MNTNNDNIGHDGLVVVTIDGSGYRTEFPDFVLDVAIPEGWFDTSWHNDVSPSWETPGHLKVWVDHADPAQREYHGRPRFCVMHADDDESDPLLETDSWDDVLKLIAECDDDHCTVGALVGRDSVWHAVLRKEVRACEGDSHVGAKIVKLAAAMQSVLDSADDFEASVEDTLISAFEKQANVWFFG